MTIQESYNSWALQYDANNNRTRDAENIALRKVLSNIKFDKCLELGCGTGKNTVWLVDKVKYLLGIDLSGEMLKKAKGKVISNKATFKQADITQPWSFCEPYYDLISFSLVLEHIADLDFVFSEASKVVEKRGYVYVGELHPFKQYSGTRARFETATGTEVVECYEHHVSAFIQAGKKYGLSVVELDEHFDDDDKKSIPRILTILFQKC